MFRFLGHLKHFGALFAQDVPYFGTPLTLGRYSFLLRSDIFSIFAVASGGFSAEFSSPARPDAQPWWWNGRHEGLRHNLSALSEKRDVECRKFKETSTGKTEGNLEPSL